MNDDVRSGAVAAAEGGEMSAVEPSADAMERAEKAIGHHWEYEEIRDELHITEVLPDVARAIEAAEARGRAAGIEEAAQWHDAEAERIGKLAAEPRNACAAVKMIEAVGDHENAAIFIRELANPAPQEPTP
jgi:hypothetical protein